MLEDLWHLRECYGQARSFRDVGIQALAAQARTARWEAYKDGGLHFRNRVKIMRHDFVTVEFIGRMRTWHGWYRRSHVILLDGVASQLRSLRLDGE